MRAMCTRSSHKQNEMIALSIIATQIQRRNGAQGRSLIFCHTSGGLLLSVTDISPIQKPTLVKFSRDPRTIQKFPGNVQIANIKYRPEAYILENAYSVLFLRQVRWPRHPCFCGGKRAQRAARQLKAQTSP